MPNIYFPESNCDECNQPTIVPTCGTDDCCDPQLISTPDIGCPVKLDPLCIIYNKLGLDSSLLTNLNLPNGTDLKTILEAIDNALGFLLPYTFPAYTSTCINYDGYIIDTMTKFLQSVDNKFCQVTTGLGTVTNNLDLYISNLTSTIDTINHPQLTDSCGLGFNTNDTIKDLIVKLKNGYCTLSANIYSDVSPIFAPINSNSITWLTGGTKNHAPTASVKKSSTAGNNLQILSDGLYVGALSQVPQVLSYNSFNRTVSLSNGGGSFVLPIDNDNQVLAFNNTTKILSITGGNNVNLSSLTGTFTQTPIVPNNTNSINISTTGLYNTNITANLKISSNVGNIATVVTDGLFVENIDNKVKADTTSSTSGYLIDKLETTSASPVTSTFSYNSGTDKVNLEVVVDEAAILSDIAGSTPLTNALYAIIENKLCFTFKIVNTSATASIYSYKDCTGTSISSVAIAGNATATIYGKAVSSPDTTTYIFNLGLNLVI